MRPLLRWTSLAGAVAALAALGHARTHLHDFPLFLGIVVAISAVTVAVFVATAGGRSAD
jgi:hypothetical protein